MHHMLMAGLMTSMCTSHNASHACAWTHAIHVNKELVLSAVNPRRAAGRCAGDGGAGGGRAGRGGVPAVHCGEHPGRQLLRLLQSGRHCERAQIDQLAGIVALREGFCLQSQIELRPRHMLLGKPLLRPCIQADMHRLSHAFPVLVCARSGACFATPPADSQTCL